MAPKARVIRDSVEREVESETLVPGDLLVLQEGDRILADGILRQCANFSADESALTGESVPVSKKTATAGFPATDESQFFAGSTVLTGQAYGEVSETGFKTRYGRIAKLVSGSEAEPTPLQKKTSYLVRQLVRVAVVVALGVMGLELFRGLSFYQAFLSAVSLTIAAMPEEFPLVFTLFLSLGAFRLSRHGVLIKRMASVETLGSTTVICVDKTGTLTAGHFELDSHLPLTPWATEEAVLEASVLACEISPADPMEKAILDHTRQHGVQVREVQDRWRLVYDYDFDPLGKHMSHVWQKKENPKAWRIVAKGALEGILEHCAISPEEREAAERENERLASHGARVLAVAGRDGGVFTGKRTEDERDLKFLGLLAFRDPLRPEVPQAVALCQQAGIRIKIVTGDHLLTAHAVADAAGIDHEPESLLNAPGLSHLPPERLLEKAARGVVFARVQPEQKYAIVEALKQSGEVVAMTGDGINDAPALKKADIGIAMGLKGTEVARASADMVLLSDSFSSIVETVKEGRRIFANIQRSFLFLIAFHIPIVALALLCPLLGLPLFYLPIHLVWLELIVHPVSALVFEAEPAAPDVMRQPPHAPQAPLLPTRLVILSALTGLLLTAAVFGFYALQLPRGEETARSAGLAVLILGILLLTWSERAGDKAWWKMPLPRTRRFWMVWLLVASSLPVILELPTLASIFRVEPLPLKDWGRAALLALAATGWRAFGWKVPPRES
jgi:Ca2+-transporting ATPase